MVERRVAINNYGRWKGMEKPQLYLCINSNVDGYQCSGFAQGRKTSRDTVQVYFSTYMKTKFNLQVQIRARVPYVRVCLKATVVRVCEEIGCRVRVGLRRPEVWCRQATCFLGLRYKCLHRDN